MTKPSTNVALAPTSTPASSPTPAAESKKRKGFAPKNGAPSGSTTTTSRTGTRFSWYSPLDHLNLTAYNKHLTTLTKNYDNSVEKSEDPALAEDERKKFRDHAKDYDEKLKRLKTAHETSMAHADLLVRAATVQKSLPREVYSRLEKSFAPKVVSSSGDKTCAATGTTGTASSVCDQNADA